MEPRKPGTHAQTDAMLTSHVCRVDAVRKAVDEAIEMMMKLEERSACVI